MPIRNIVKPALLTLAVCIAVGSAVGFERILGNMLAPPPAPAPSGGISIGEVEIEEDEENEVKCILKISQCPVDNPNCGREPLRIELSCSDASCLAAPQSCSPVHAPASSARSNPSSARSNSSIRESSNSCMLRRFECSKESLSSCYKRWRTTSLNCTENICGTANCLRSDVFFSTYKLEVWDTESLPGPFPRTEIMCIVQSSPCAPNDPLCISPISLEQISCDDAKCIAGTCTRMNILVDQHDTIVSNIASGTSGTSGTGKQTEEDEKDREEVENENKGTGNTNGTINKALGCFDEDGLWTTDRSKCASNQKKFVMPTNAPSTGGPIQNGGTQEEQKIVERTIESQFVPDTRKSALVQNILSSTVDATSRLTRILENQALPSDVRTDLEQKLGSLRTIQGIVSGSDQSVRDLQALADGVAHDLNGVQETVTEWMETSPRSFPITVTTKLDRLFSSLPSIFGILLQEGIAIDSTTMDAYLAAQQTYDAVHATCIANSDTCGNLSKVIDALEPVYASIRLSLEKAGRTDLENQIDALLQ